MKVHWTYNYSKEPTISGYWLFSGYNNQKKITLLIFKLFFLYNLPSYIFPEVLVLSWEDMWKSLPSLCCAVNFSKQVLNTILFSSTGLEKWCYQQCSYMKSKRKPALQSTPSALHCVTVSVMPQWRQMDKVWTIERHSCCAMMTAAVALKLSSHGMSFVL